ncbi:MAG: hypothetical protein ACFFCZ_24790, partial [Promethearchaeota archaeon]
MENANFLRMEAEAILNELNLVNLLKSFGDARIVGSVVLDLIVKRDIDIHVLVQTSNLLSVVNSVYPLLLNFEKIHEVRISDYREEGGIKIGIDVYPGTSDNWSIDIWITNKFETTAFEFMNYLQDQLTPEHRKII